MSQQIPDVRVRLSAEGTEEIVRAFQRVAAAGKSAGKTGGSGIGLLNKALGDLRSILPTIGVAATVVGIGALVKQALSGADAIGKLAQKTGIGTEALSALQVAASTADVNFDQLSDGLIKFNRSMAELDGGSRETSQAVRQLFGSAQALNGLNTEERFAKVATALGKLDAGYVKTRLSQQFFGKSGADLIPLMNDIAAKGMGPLTEEARKLGLLVGPGLADAAQRANDAMTSLKNSVKGAAMQFTTGFAPALAGTLEAMSTATSGAGKSGFETLGEKAGKVLRGIVAGFLIIGETIGFEVGEWAIWFDDFGQHAKDVFRGVALTAKTALGAVTGNVAAFISASDVQAAADRAARRATAAAAAKARREEFDVALGQRLNTMFDTPKPGTKKPGGTGAGAVPDAAAEKAKLDAARAGVEQRLALQKAQLAQQAQLNDSAYQRGLTSLQAYYDEAERIARAGDAGELDALRAKEAEAEKIVAITDAEITSRAKDIAAIKAEIERKEIEQATAAAARLDKRTTDELALAQRRLDIERQIAEAQGRNFDAAVAAIKKQSADLTRSGVDPTRVAALEQLLIQQAAFTEAERQSALGLGEVAAIQDRLQAQVASGAIFPFQAAERYRAAVLAMLPDQERLVQRVEAAAKGNAELEAAARKLRAEFEALRGSTDVTGQQMAQFKAQAESALTSDLANFLTDGIDKAKGLGDAFRSLALSVVTSLRQIVAQYVATAGAQKLLGVFGAKSGDQGVAGAAAKGAAQAAPITLAAGALDQSGNKLITAGGTIFAAALALGMAADKAAVINAFATAGSLFRLGIASGGLVRGPGSGTSDSIAARLSDGEFVVRSAAVRQPGVLPLLAGINAGDFAAALRPLTLRPASGVPRFADGGLVTGSAAASGLNRDHILVDVSSDLVVRQIESGPGSRAVVRAVQANRRAIRSALGL